MVNPRLVCFVFNFFFLFLSFLFPSLTILHSLLLCRPIMLFSSFTLLVFTIFQSLLGFVTATQCYWPNGDPAGDNWTPCGDSKVCCAAGEACLSNKLCYESNLNVAYRGACADKSWPLAECPRICYDRKSSPPLSIGSPSLPCEMGC